LLNSKVRIKRKALIEGFLFLSRVEEKNIAHVVVGDEKGRELFCI